MTKVTGLPSGQRLVWALQSLTRSGTVAAPIALDLFETRAMSRAAASEAASTTKTKIRKKRWQSTLVLPTKSIELRKIVLEERSFVKGNEGHEGEGRAEGELSVKRGAAGEAAPP